MGELVVEFLDDVFSELQQRNKENEGPFAAQNPAVAESLLPPRIKEGGGGAEGNHVRVAWREIFFNLRLYFRRCWVGSAEGSKKSEKDIITTINNLH